MRVTDDRPLPRLLPSPVDRPCSSRAPNASRLAYDSLDPQVWSYDVQGNRVHMINETSNLPPFLV